MLSDTGSLSPLTEVRIHTKGRSCLAMSLVFSGLGADGMFTSYYVVAVDVAGKVSEPSAIVGGTAPGFEVPGDNEANPDDDIDNPDDGLTEGDPNIDLELGNEGRYRTVCTRSADPCSYPEGFQATWAAMLQRKRLWSTTSTSAQIVTAITRFLAQVRARSSITPPVTIGGTFRVTAVNPIGESLLHRPYI